MFWKRIGHHWLLLKAREEPLADSAIRKKCRDFIGPANTPSAGRHRQFGRRFPGVRQVASIVREMYENALYLIIR